MLAAILLAAVAPAPAPATTPAEERLILGAIEALRPQIPAADAVRFRRVHFRTTIGTDGAPHLGLCGQVHMDDPRAELGWTIFVTLPLDDRHETMIGRRGLVDARIFCPPSGAAWDYGRDFAGRFTAALRRPLR